MPDFGLGEALAAALKGASDAKVMRPAEAELAARAAKGAVGKAASDIPAAADLSAAPKPTIDPGAPPTLPNQPPAVETGPPPAAAPVDPTAAQPASPGIAAPAAAQAPASAAPDASAAATDGELPTHSGDPAVPSMAPEGVATPARPDPSPTAGAIPEVPPPKPDPLGASVQADAERFTKLNIGADINLEASHIPNIGVMDTTPDVVKASIVRLAEDNKDAILKAMGGSPVPDATLRALAENVPGGSAAVIQQVLEREVGTNFSSSVIALAANIELTNSAGTWQALAIKGVNGVATPEEILAYHQQKAFLEQYIPQIGGAQTEGGRTLHAMGLDPGMNPKVRDHLLGIIQAHDPDLQREMAAVANALSPKGIATIAQGGIVRRSINATIAMVNRIFVNGILSSPATWLKIFDGNTFNNLVNLSDIAVAARIGQFLPGAEHVQVGEATANFHGQLDAAMDAFRAAGRVLKTGVSMDQVLRSQEGGLGVKNTLHYLPELNTDKFFINRIVNFVDHALEAPGSRFVSAVDTFSQTLAYRGYKTQQAYLAVRDALASGKLPADADSVRAFAEKFMSSNDPAIDQAAELWAHRISYQEPLGVVGEAILNVLDKAPVLRLVVPFMRTSTNILKQGLIERTPLGLAAGSFWNAMRAGGPQRDMALARMTTGSMAAAGMAYAVTRGIVTGGGPTEPKARAIWLLDHAPYSVRIPNLQGGADWHSYANLEPIATALGSVADATEITARIYAYNENSGVRDDEAKIERAVDNIVMGITTNLDSKSFMMGVVKFSEMWADPQRAFQAYKNDMLSSLVPYSAGTRFVRKETDPYLREAHTLMDEIRNNYPEYSDKEGFPKLVLGLNGSRSLPVAKNVYGEPRMEKSGSLMGVMSAIPDEPDKYDDVTKELASVMHDTQTVPVTMPSRLYPLKGGGGVEGGASIRLNDQEYSDLIDKARSAPIFAGKNFHDALGALIDSPGYQQATVSQRSAFMANLQSRADEIGRAALLRENDDFRERYATIQAAKNQVKFNR